jgi:uncharacterized protein YegP (UPF0339 family)
LTDYWRAAMLSSLFILELGEIVPREFQVFVDTHGGYQWRLMELNGETIAVSPEGYTTRSGAVDAIERVKKTAPDAPTRDLS